MRIPTFRLASYYFIYLAALGLFSPYFPLFLDERGHSPWMISFMMSLWYATRIFSPSAWGHLTQRSRQPVYWLRLGTFLSFVCFLGFLLRLPPLATAAVMALFSFFCNAVMPQFEAITLSHLHERPHRYGRIRLWGSLGFMLTVTAGGVLFDYVDIAHLPLIMLPLFGLLILSAFWNDYGPHHHSAQEKESLWASLQRPGVIPFLAAGFLMQLAHGPYYVFFSLFLGERGYSAAAVGGFWAVGILVEIAMFWFSSQLLARFGGVRLMRFCMAVAALRFVLTALFVDSAAWLLLAQLGHALSFGLFHSACMLRITRLFPGRLLGQGQGLWYGLASGIGGVTGALLAGKFWAMGGGRAAFLGAALAASAGFWVTWRLMAPGPPPAKPT